MSIENKSFAYTGVKSEKSSFTWRIEKFSVMHAHTGRKTKSPEFESKPSGSKWYLSTHVNEEYASDSDCKRETFINIYLNNIECDSNLSVNVNISIVGCLGKSWVYGSKVVQFDGANRSWKVFSISKASLMDGFFNELRLLPSDALTLQCDMIIYEEASGKTFDSEEDFEIDYKNSGFHEKHERLKFFCAFSIFSTLLLLCGFFAALSLYVVSYMLAAVIGVILIAMMIIIPVFLTQPIKTERASLHARAKQTYMQSVAYETNYFSSKGLSSRMPLVSQQKKMMCISSVQN